MAVSLLTVPLAASWTTQATAFELLGFCIIKPCDKEAGTEFIDPHTYDVDFLLDPSMSDEMKDDILAASELWRGRDKPVAGGAGIISRAKSDYRRILAALYNSGRYAGEISIQLNGREVSDFETGEDLPQNSDLLVTVNPGPKYLLGRTSIINQAPETFDEKDQVEQPSEIGFAPGSLARADVVQKATDLSINAWRQQGYPKAALLSKEVIANHPNNQLNVTLHLDSGPKAAYGELVVSGANNMDPEFLAYMTGLKPGQEYDPDDIKKAYKRLDRLGVLATRNISEADAVTRTGALPLQLLVKERALRRFGVGASMSSTDGAGVEAYWLHRNLFGKAERLRLDAKFSGVGATDQIHKYDYSVGATFTKPGVFSPDTDFTSNVYAKHENNESYEEDGFGGSGKFTHFLSNEVTLAGGGFVEVSEFRDKFGKRNFTTTGVEGDVVYDIRDNKLDPTSGIYARFNAKPFYEWQFANPGARFETEARTYHALDKKARTVLAARVKVGSVLGDGIAKSAPSFLFNAGGGNSVRGFDYKGIGIVDAAGKESAGKSLFEASLEVRQKIVGNFGAVAFVDVGTVGSERLIDFDEELSVGVGVGLRYYTGLGPIRLDVAIPMNKTAGDSDFAFYAGLGQAF
ncbi:MAG: autotransporter assembly complex family protein [Rhizobiaceae bacterium]